MALLVGVGLALWGLAARQAMPSVVRSGTTGARAGDIAPDFTVITLDGNAFTLSEQRGKPTLIFFMAYWCGACIPEAQALAKLQREYGDQLSIIAIDVDPTSTAESLANFRRAADDGAFIWAFDSGQQVSQAYEVRSLDTTLILDEVGVVIYRDEVPSSYATLKNALIEAGY